MSSSISAEDALEAVYRNNPHIYVEQVLGVKWWDKQIEAGYAVVKHKLVAIQASNGVGKTAWAGGINSWHYDMFNPGLTIATAPSMASVVDGVFKEIRAQRSSLREVDGKGFRPTAPHLQHENEPRHYLKGVTATSEEAFKGKHEEHNLICMDEAIGIKKPIWTATRSMMIRKYSRHVVIFNPTDTSSYLYGLLNRRDTPWHVINISALDHPNIKASLRGEEPPYPNAVQIFQVDEHIGDCEEINPRDRRSGDIWWSLPGWDGRRDLDNPILYRPTSGMESSVLGRWPSESTGSIWSESIWKAACRHPDSGLKPIPDSKVYCEQLEIGADQAWTIRDKSSIISRRGMAGLSRRSGAGWKVPIIAEEIKAMIYLQIQKHNDYYRHNVNFVGEDPSEVLIKADHDATGDALREHMAGYNFTTMSGARTPINENLYNNGRSESWFTVCEMADKEQLDLSRLGEDVLSEMRPQALAQKWTMDAKGRRVADKKELTRKILGGSPDDLDALNNAFSQQKGAVMRAPVILLPGGVLAGGQGMGLPVAPAGPMARLAPSWNSPLTGGMAETNARRILSNGNSFDWTRGPQPS